MRTKTPPTAALAAVLLLASGCTTIPLPTPGNPDTPMTNPTQPATASPQTPPPTVIPTPDHQVITAPWAEPITTGRTMWHTTKDGWTITGYDMGTDTASQDSYYSDDETNLPIILKGQPIVMVNIVATNTTDHTLYIATDEPELWAMPTATGYTQGLAGVAPANTQQTRNHGIWHHNYTDSTDMWSPFPVEPGESCALGYVLPLNLGNEYTFIPQLYAYNSHDEAIGHTIRFDQQTYTFPY